MIFCDALVFKLNQLNRSADPTEFSMEARFKGLGEMNPLQLRESTIDPDTRRLVQLTVDSDQKKTNELIDMLLAKKHASDRKAWLEKKGDLATI